ncbi:MAG: hypothetical protein OEZ36_13755 [Spirochaetota bacterium]|nr:hypothetical protein [Spirochaetota bacterium]
MLDNQRETRTAHIQLASEGILLVDIIEGSEITIDDARENLQALASLSPESGWRVLVNISKIKSVTRECRAFAASQNTHKYIAQLALVVIPKVL